MTPQDRDAIQVFGMGGTGSARKMSAQKYGSLKNTPSMGRKRVESIKSLKGSSRSNSGMKVKNRAMSPMSGGSAYGPTYIRNTTNIPKMALKKTVSN